MTVLVLRALGLGDFLTGVPAYRALRAAFPSEEIVLAAPEALRPLAGLTGAIDRLLPTAELAPIAWSGAPPDLAIDLHGSGPASHRLITALEPGRALMYAPGHGPEWRDDEHEVARWCRLLQWAGIPADPRALRLRRPEAGSAPPVAVVHPGAASGSRRWPVERFAAVARELSKDRLVVLTGGPAEGDLSIRTARLAGLPDDAVRRPSLTELATLVADAGLVVCGDTGISHLATAYGTRSVTLLGPVSPALWGPPDDPRHVALWHGTGLRPGDPHAAEPDPRLLAISVEEVLAAVRQLT